MLSDPSRLGNVDDGDPEPLFDPEFWRRRGELAAAPGGRGAAWFVGAGERQWVLRHFRRGGFIARVSRDSYVWMGEGRVRAFAEWRLLNLLTDRGLRVPRPIIARYQKSGLIYRCDLITQRILDTETLSALLGKSALPEAAWRAVGAAVAQLHSAGVDHADLNAHNVLLDSKGMVSVIDFDRGRERAPGTWSTRNLQRLQCSLAKIASGLPPGRYSAEDWQWLLAGYQAG